MNLARAFRNRFRARGRFVTIEVMNLWSRRNAFVQRSTNTPTPLTRRHPNNANPRRRAYPTKQCVVAFGAVAAAASMQIRRVARLERCDIFRYADFVCDSRSGAGLPLPTPALLSIRCERSS
eukprot:8181663-Lingulodinium_polyedra.AAC.1